MLDDVFRATTLWITSTRAVTQDGRACRDVAVHDAEGTPLLAAQALPWSREIVLHAPGRPDDVVMVIERRRSFTLTGDVDVFEGATRRSLGVLHRSGRVHDATGAMLGQFVDARSLKRRATESLVEGIGAAIVGGDTVGATSATAFVYRLEERVIGELVHAPLPFTVGPRPDESTAPNVWTRLARFVPSHVRDGIAARMHPRGWQFTRRDVPLREDPRPSLAGAILMVEQNPG